MSLFSCLFPCCSTSSQAERLVTTPANFIEILKQAKVKKIKAENLVAFFENIQKTAHALLKNEINNTIAALENFFYLYKAETIPADAILAALEQIKKYDIPFQDLISLVRGQRFYPGHLEKIRGLVQRFITILYEKNLPDCEKLLCDNQAQDFSTYAKTLPRFLKKRIREERNKKQNVEAAAEAVHIARELETEYTFVGLQELATRVHDVADQYVKKYPHPWMDLIV